MIYYCKTCGVWQPVAFAQAIKDAWNAAMKSKPDAQMPQGYPCPHGHGMMVQMQANDRISVKSLVVEAVQGEVKEEQSQIFKFNETDDQVYACLAWDMTKCTCVDVKNFNYGEARDRAKGLLWDKYGKEILEFMRPLVVEAGQGEDQ